MAAGKDNVASFGVKVTSTVSGVTLENETHLTIKMIAVFSPTLILSVITGILGLLVGTGVIFKVLELRQKAKEAAEKAQKDPSDKESLQQEVESETEETDLLIKEGGKKSRAAETSFKNVQKTVDEAGSRLRTDKDNNFSEGLRRTLDSLSKQIQAELSRREDDTRTLENSIRDLERKIKSTVDRSIVEELEASRRALERRFEEMQRQMQELERKQIEERKEAEEMGEKFKEMEKVSGE